MLKYNLADILATLEMAGFSFIKSDNFNIWYAYKSKDKFYWSSNKSMEDCIEGTWSKYVKNDT